VAAKYFLPTSAWSRSILSARRERVAQKSETGNGPHPTGVFCFYREDITPICSAAFIY
jgi:hypothetical protein